MATLSRFTAIATARRLYTTDVVGLALGLAAPVGALILGSRLPQDAARLLAVWLVATLVAVAALRIVNALARLRHARMRDRAVHERAYRSSRGEFASDLRAYLEPMSQGQIMRLFNNETIARLNKRASLFMTDRDFNPLWTRFVSHFEHEAAVAYYDEDREIDEDEAIQVSRNLNHCLQVRRAIVQALIDCLTARDGFAARLDARLAQIEAEYAALGMIDLFAPRPEAASQTAP